MRRLAAGQSLSPVVAVLLVVLALPVVVALPVVLAGCSDPGTGGEPLGAAIPDREGTSGAGDVFHRDANGLLLKTRKLLDVAGADYQARVLSAVSAAEAGDRVQDLAPALERLTVQEGAPARALPSPILALSSSEAVVAALEQWPNSRLPGGLNFPQSTTTAGRWFRLALPDRPLRDTLGRLELRMRVSSGARMRLAWHGVDSPAVGAGLSVDLRPGTAMQDYRVELSRALRRGLRPGEALGGLYLWLPGEPGRDVEVESLRLLPRGASLVGTMGREGFILEGELRPAVWLRGAGELRAAVDVGAERTRLETAVGMLGGTDGCRVAVRVEGVGEGKAAAQLSPPSHDAPLIHDAGYAGPRWEPVRVELGEWQGRRVLLRFVATGPGCRVVLWARPTLVTPPRKPVHVVLVVQDTLRADYLSVYGGPAASPALGQLARDGVLFRRALSQATKTRPSVPSYMTGLLPSATGVRNFHDALPDAYVTLAEILSAAGFATASFVQNGNAGPYAGLHQGFDVLLDDEALGEDTEAAFGERVRAHLKSVADRNTFTYIHVLDPHGPYDPPEPFRPKLPPRGDSAASGSAPVPRGRALDPAWLEAPTPEDRRLLYSAEIERNDALLGEFLEWLRADPRFGKSLVVHLSDHGEYLGEEGFWAHHPPGYMPVTRVPLLFSMPGVLPAGIEVRQPVGLIDVVPTVLDLLGLGSGRLKQDVLRMQGHSLRPLVTAADAGGHGTPRMVVSEEPSRSSPDGPPSGCGSVHVGDWQILVSRERCRRAGASLSGGSRAGACPAVTLDVSAELAAPSVPPEGDENQGGLRFAARAERSSVGVRAEALPWADAASDVRKLLEELEVLGRAVRAKMVSGSGGIPGAIAADDPDVRQRLRALGYVD